MPKYANLEGKRFGRLIVLEKTSEREKGYCVWICRCDCGNEIRVNTKRLTRGVVTNCGCIPKTDARRGKIAEDLTGRTFSNLKVLYRAKNKQNRTAWMCACGCGKRKVVTAHDLKAGKVKSCGCGQKDGARTMVDLTGMRIGRLTMLYPTEKRKKNGSVIWHCRCDCGEECEVSESGLMHGNYRSCGCMRSEIQKNINKQLHMIDGTCIEILEKRKWRRDNKSGFRGVYKRNDGRYRVDLGFKGRRFYLGTFNGFEQAVQVRLEAEKLIHDNFVKEWYEWNEKAAEDPEWADEHPFLFEVERRNGELVVTKSIMENKTEEGSTKGNEGKKKEEDSGADAWHLPASVYADRSIRRR